MLRVRSIRIEILVREEECCTMVFLELAVEAIRKYFSRCEKINVRLILE